MGLSFTTQRFPTPAQAQQVSLLQTNITNYVTQSTVQFIVGQKSISNDWDAFLAHLKALGLDKYVKINQEAYSASHQSQ